MVSISCARAVLVLAPFLAAASARAQVTIDFESFNLGGNVFLDTPETLAFPNAGGSGVDVTIQGHDDVRIYDLFLFGGNPGATGQALIDMNWSNYNNTLGTDIVFSAPVHTFSLLAGDFGGDDDSPLSIVAYDASNTVIGSASSPWPAGAFPPFALVQINANGIRRVHFQSGGTFANSTFVDDVTFTPDVSGPVVYCTSGTTTHGCSASIASSGNPNVAHSAPCQITVTNVEGQKTGLVFYGLSAQAVPWCGVGGTSFLCIKAPTQRTLAQNSSGTTNSCDGTLALDWNVFQLGNPGALGQPWAAGTKADVQGWFRDPASCKTTSLSNALELTYQP